MTVVQGGSWLPTVEPPDIATLAVAYLGVFPTDWAGLIGTQLPGPDSQPDEFQQLTVDGFVRVEEIGTTPANELEFDCDFAIHAYHPNEITASRVNRRLSTRAGNAQGSTITIGSGDWYVGWTRVVVESQRQKDPTVDLPRLRSMVTWRVAGHQLEG